MPAENTLANTPMPLPHPPPAEPRPEEPSTPEAGARRGRLKIFLGAAPGVGKTTEMLTVGHELRREGVDVVVGLVDSHGREAVEALVGGFEVIPRRRLAVAGDLVEDMDLDAILQRRPALVLIDDLAHRNAPGCRHHERHLDVEELLAAGIDVFTTLNIQDMESLNDVVAQIIGVRVHDTVPDGVLDGADEIELVDLTPADLIKRLREGKIAVPEPVAKAVDRYFSPGNLNALRELTLIRTAQRLDEQVLTFMRAETIRGPWAAGERILVCIDAETSAAALVRYARRVADRLHAKWTAIYIETPAHAGLSEVERDRIADTLRLAERLDGEAITIPGGKVADDLIAYAQANNITQIIVGKPKRSRLMEVIRGSIVYRLIRRAGPISIHVMAGDDSQPVPPKTVATRPPAPRLGLPGFLYSTLMVAGALAISLGLDLVLPAGNLLLVFMVAVIGSAFLFGLGPSLLASVLSVLAFSFFFIPPVRSLNVADPSNAFALLFFLVLAVLTSNLAVRARGQMETARNRARITAELHAFSRKLAGIGQLDDLLWATAHQIASMLRLRVVILLPDGEGLAVRAGYPPEDRIDEAELAAARWAWDNNRPAGRGAATLSRSRRLFLPMRTQRGPVGLVGIDSDRQGPLLTPDQRRLLDALADQTAVAIERISLARAVDETRLLTETERLRSALLASISHDLRTPLTTITGAIGSLRSAWLQFDGTARDELLETVEQEAERLSRFVDNLLHMTRLESGALDPQRETVALGDVVAAALDRSGRALAHHDVRVDLPPNLPKLQLDFVLFEQVLVNLMDNAAKFAPRGSTIALTARCRGGRLTLSLSDQGPGIAAADLERIFDKFYRRGDAKWTGTGVGLAICRGFVDALGGSIHAHNRTDGPGTVFTIELPAEPSPPETPEPDPRHHAVRSRRK